MVAATPKKSLGQHWLNDLASLQAMCAAADVQPEDLILEVGPGPGSLTKLLVQKAHKIVAVELDKDLAADLSKSVPNGNLKVIAQNILDFDFSSLPSGYKLVANIPYYLTSNLIRVISEEPNPPQIAVLLVQKEVAQRVAALPGDMSLLSVTAQFYWQVSLGPGVAAHLFEPPPKVDSQILILKRRSQLLFPDVDTKAFFRLTKAGFAQRRKTLLNSLSSGLHLEKDIIQASCEAAAIDPKRRAQTLSLDEWHNLYLSLNFPAPK